MEYQELLLTSEWQEKRMSIVDRDNMTCTMCMNERRLGSLNSSVFVRSKLNNEEFVRYNLRDDIVKFVYVKANLFRLQNMTIPDTIIVVHEPIKKYSLTEIIESNRIDENFIKKINRVSPVAIRELSDDENHFHINHLLASKSFIDSHDEYYWIFNKTLHVHHKYYNLKKLPWEYPNEALTTLCDDCHKEVHAKNKIPLVSDSGVQICLLDSCTTCSGTGTRPEYNYYMGGVCFSCGGSGIRELDKIF